MEINNLQEQFVPQLQNFQIENFLKCPECNLICFLNIKYIKENLNIEYLCENNHKGTILLKEYMNNFINNLKLKCLECQKFKQNYYCIHCFKYLCEDCSKIHLFENKHKLIDLNQLNIYCQIHLKKFSFFCFTCQKNICEFCKSTHIEHCLIDLIKYDFSKETEEKLIKDYNNVFKIIKDLEVLIQKIELIISQLKDYSLLIKFYKILVTNYLYSKKENVHNYYFIKNLKQINQLNSHNIKDLFNHFNDCNKIFKNLEQLNLNFQKDYLKPLNYHSNWITHLDKLNDGRLISSSSDHSLKIYKKESYEIEISILEHSKSILFFTQLNDGRIITCSSDRTLKIIKLIEENKYKIEQILIKHKGVVFKVIEIRNNELISISNDNTMKIWRLNNKNEFECNLTILFQTNNSYCNIYNLNKNEFITSSCDIESLIFWNSNNYSKITSIKNIKTTGDSLKNMCLLDNDVLCVGTNDSNGFYLIRITNHQIIQNVIGPKIIWSIIKCLDGSFVCSMVDENNIDSLVIYKYENYYLKKIKQMKTKYKKSIYSCVEIDEGLIAYGGYDRLIHFWNISK